MTKILYNNYHFLWNVPVLLEKCKFMIHKNLTANFSKKRISWLSDGGWKILDKTCLTKSFHRMYAVPSFQIHEPEVHKLNTLPCELSRLLSSYNPMFYQLQQMYKKTGWHLTFIFWFLHFQTPRIQAGTVSKWQCLPDEILIHIFAYLDQTSLTKCAQVCQQFYRVAMDESLCKFHFIYFPQEVITACLSIWFWFICSLVKTLLHLSYEWWMCKIPIKLYTLINHQAWYKD